MPAAPDGTVDMGRLEQQLQQQRQQKSKPRVRLMELTLAPSGWDVWQAGCDIARIAQAHNIPLAVDASQALGQSELDVNDLGCDFLFASGRKWLAGSMRLATRAAVFATTMKQPGTLFTFTRFS